MLIRFDDDMINRAKALAAERHTGYQTPIKQFVTDAQPCYAAGPGTVTPPGLGVSFGLDGSLWLGENRAHGVQRDEQRHRLQRRCDESAREIEPLGLIGERVHQQREDPCITGDAHGP